MGGKQLSFADALSDPRLGANRRLEAIGAAIDWAPLAALSARLRPGRTGRPPYEPLVMLKALLLQRLYALSDPQLEDSSIGCRSGVFAALRPARARPTRRRCAASARTRPRAACSKPASTRSTGSSPRRA